MSQPKWWGARATARQRALERANRNTLEPQEGEAKWGSQVGSEMGSCVSRALASCARRGAKGQHTIARRPTSQLSHVGGEGSLKKVGGTKGRGGGEGGHGWRGGGGGEGYHQGAAGRLDEGHHEPPSRARANWEALKGGGPGGGQEPQGGVSTKGKVRTEGGLGAIGAVTAGNEGVLE